VVQESFYQPLEGWLADPVIGRSGHPILWNRRVADVRDFNAKVSVVRYSSEKFAMRLAWPRPVVNIYRRIMSGQDYVGTVSHKESWITCDMGGS